MPDLSIPADIIDGVQEIMELVGIDAYIRVRVNSGTGYDPTITDTDNAVILVPVAYKLKDIDGEVIKQGDRQFLLLTEFEPSTSDFVVLGGDIYTIISIQIVAVSGITVLYKIQGRK